MPAKVFGVTAELCVSHSFLLLGAFELFCINGITLEGNGQVSCVNKS